MYTKKMDTCNKISNTKALDFQDQQENPRSSFDDVWFTKKKKSQVFLEGYVVESVTEEEDQDGSGPGSGSGSSSKGVSRTVSLTDEDLDDLKGCVDLGFGFSYDEIPELCNTLPALELCYSLSQRFLEDQNHLKSNEGAGSENGNESCSNSSNASAVPIANWKISSPGDHPEEVKARLKFWAQAVACTVKLCS